jgi:hypothetical protein
VKSTEMMRLCSSDGPFVRVDEIHKVIRKEMNAQDGNLEESKREAARLDEMIVESNPDFTMWRAEVLEAIDRRAAQEFANCCDDIGTFNGKYLEALGRYVNEVAEIIKAYNPHNPKKEITVARFIWLMRVSKNRNPPTPLITEWVFDSIYPSLLKTNRALKEVCRNIPPSTNLRRVTIVPLRHIVTISICRGGAIASLRHIVTVTIWRREAIASLRQIVTNDSTLRSDRRSAQYSLDLNVD